MIRTDDIGIMIAGLEMNEKMFVEIEVNGESMIFPVVSVREIKKPSGICLETKKVPVEIAVSNRGNAN